jgi:hypothetical protein
LARLFSWRKLGSTTLQHQDEIRQKICFTDRTLLRGSRSSTVLQHFGLMLNTSAGNEQTYRKSGRVHHIDTFISHNWATPREKKFRTLALNFHYTRAVGLTLLAAFAVLPLSGLGWLPMTEFYTYDLDEVYMWAPYATVGGPLLFLLLTFGWQELGVCVPVADQVVFLDKACIHQTNNERKREGVHSLAAFIRHSERMLVVYTDTYLEKLWTVYELASFLAIHPRHKLDVLPVFLPVVIVISVLVYTVFHVTVVYTHSTYVIDAMYFGHDDMRQQHRFVYASVVMMFGLPTCTVCALLFRIWLQTLQLIERRASEFSVEAAKCFDEADRPIVQEGIHVFMKAIGRVVENSSEEQALQSFNRMVQQELPKALRRSFGTVGFQYRYVWVMSLGAGLMAIDLLGSGLHTGHSAWRLLVDFLREMTKHIAVLPLVVAVISKCMMGTLETKNNVAILAAGVLVGFTGTFTAIVPLVILDTLKRRAYSSIGWSLAYLCACLILIAIVAFVYRFPGVDKLLNLLNSLRAKRALSRELTAVVEQPRADPHLRTSASF